MEREKHNKHKFVTVKRERSDGLELAWNLPESCVTEGDEGEVKKYLDNLTASSEMHIAYAERPWADAPEENGPPRPSFFTGE